MKNNQTYANLLSRTVEAYISTFYYKGYRVEVYRINFNRKIYRVSKSYTYKVLNNFFFRNEALEFINYLDDNKKI
ncbi:hypothetical protein [Staphylococcus hominis]|uniref:hypothetical protein n=1 Tax=Staphylococcus hominis TaxID=1290 RepID=UPI0008A621FE